MQQEKTVVPYEIACQLASDMVRVFENSLHLNKVHADIFLEDFHLIREHPMSFWDNLSYEFAKLNIVPSVHLPFYGLNLGSRSQLIRNVSLDCLNHGLEIANSINARIAVMHTGFVPVIVGKARTKWLSTFVHNFLNVKRRADSFGVRLLLENTWEADPDIFCNMEEMIGEKLQFCFDFGHANVFSKAPRDDWFSFMNGNIFALHVHDNFGMLDSHLPPGMGNIDFSPLSFLSNSSGRPRVILEHKVKHFNYAIKFISDFLPSDIIK